jgi:hypothetical protein
MRKPLDALITHAALCFMHANDRISDHFINESESPSLRNVCAKVSAQLSDRLDDTTRLLGISKRAFIECALLEALEKSDQILANEGIWEYLNTRCSVDPEEQVKAEEAIQLQDENDAIERAERNS